MFKKENETIYRYNLIKRSIIIANTLYGFRDCKNLAIFLSIFYDNKIFSNYKFTFLLYKLIFDKERKKVNIYSKNVGENYVDYIIYNIEIKKIIDKKFIEKYRKQLLYDHHYRYVEMSALQET
jgi:hypothetical protein